MDKIYVFQFYFSYKNNKMKKFFAQFSLLIVYSLFNDFFTLTKQHLDIPSNESLSIVEESQCGKSSYTPSRLNKFNASNDETTKMQVSRHF